MMNIERLNNNMMIFNWQLVIWIDNKWLVQRKCHCESQLMG